MYPGHWAKVFPDKPAVIDVASGATRTYRELNDRSNRLAQLMWRRGLRRGDHVSIFMENNPVYFDVVWAALRSGLYLTTVNRYLTAEEAGYIVDNSESKVLVTSQALTEIATEIPQHAPNCHTWLMADGAADGYEHLEDALATAPAEPLAEEPAGSFMLYSSGTTGRPKGILRPLPEGSIAEDNSPVGGLQQGLVGLRRKRRVLVSGAPLPLRAHRLLPSRAGARRHSGDAAPIRSGAVLAGHRGSPSEPQPVGAHHVHAHVEAARGGAQRLRPILAQGGDPRRGAVPAGREAADVRLVGGRSSTNTTAARN